MAVFWIAESRVLAQWRIFTLGRGKRNLLSARPCTKCFTGLSDLNNYNNPLWWGHFLCHRFRNWVTGGWVAAERFSLWVPGALGVPLWGEGTAPLSPGHPWHPRALAPQWFMRCTWSVNGWRNSVTWSTNSVWWQLPYFEKHQFWGNRERLCY